jgi:hypothetical protein
MFIILSVLSLAFFGLIPLIFFKKKHFVVCFEVNKSRIEKLKDSVYIIQGIEKPLFYSFQDNLSKMDKVLYRPNSLEDVSIKDYLLLLYLNMLYLRKNEFTKSFGVKFLLFEPKLT